LTFLRDDLEQNSSRQEFQEMETAVNTAITTARQLSVDLSPPILANEGLTEAINWLGTQMQAQYGLEIELQAEGSFLVPEVERRALLFRIVREALFNVVKHAGVQQATVRLEQANGEYLIEVSDKGVGFDPEQQLSDKDGDAAGGGLLRGRERLRFIGGRIEFESAPGEGTCVTITAPVATEPAPTQGRRS
jgi:signal transduction histidine kinase